MSQKPSVLLLLQGWGLSTSWEKNAILSAKTPNFELLWRKYDHKVLNPASNITNINPEIYYRAFYNEDKLAGSSDIIDRAFSEKTILQSTALQSLFGHILQHSSKLHLFLTISRENQFGRAEHLLEMIRLAKINGIFRIKVHLFIDELLSKEAAIEKVRTIEIALSSAGLEVTTIHPLSMADSSDFSNSIDLLLSGNGKRVLSAVQAFSVSKNRLLSSSYITSSDPNFKILDFDGVLFCDHTLSALSPLLVSLNNADKYHQKSMPRYLEIYSFLPATDCSGSNHLIPSPSSGFISLLKESGRKGLILSDDPTIDLIESITKLPGNVDLLRIGSQSNANLLEHQIRSFFDNLKKAIEKDYDFIIADLPFLYRESRHRQFNQMVKIIRLIDNFLPEIELCIINSGGMLNISSFYGLAEHLSFSPISVLELPQLLPSPLPLITISEDNLSNNKKSFDIADLLAAHDDLGLLRKMLIRH